MQKEGIRESSRSSDVVFAVIIRKPDELHKVCIDFNKLEKVTVYDPELMSQKVIDPFGGQVINQFNYWSGVKPTQCAVNKAIQKFQNFLYGKEFILETDHQPSCT